MFQVRERLWSSEVSALGAAVDPFAGRRVGVLAPQVVLVAAVATVFLLICYALTGLHDLPTRGLGYTLNDQVGYVTVARNLVETGNLHSDVVYPSFLDQRGITKDYLYLPGFYFVLALSYSLFGYGVIQSLLPNILAYAITAGCVFAIGARFYGHKVALTAVILFMAFPMNLVFALTAMSEMALVAAATLALAVFVYLPLRAKVLLGPFLVLLPLIFRETGAAVAAPMALLILRDGNRTRYRDVVVFVLLAGVAILGFLRSDLSSGRPSLLLTNVLSGDWLSSYGRNFALNYTDAFALNHIHLGLTDWLSIVMAKFVNNVVMLVRGLGFFFGFLEWRTKWILATRLGVDTHPLDMPFFIRLGSRIEIVSVGLMIATLPLSLRLGFRRRDPVMFGAAALVAAPLAAVLLVYAVWHMHAVRILLLTAPLGCVVWAVAVQRFAKRLTMTRFNVLLTHRSTLGLACALSAMGVFVATTTLSGSQPATATGTVVTAEEDVAFLESLHHDDHTLLMTPWQLGLDYVYKHHPVKWSFPAANRETLHLVNSTYQIGTVVLDDAANETGLTVEDLTAEGFELQQRVLHAGKSYVVFKRVDMSNRAPSR